MVMKVQLFNELLLTSTTVSSAIVLPTVAAAAEGLSLCVWYELS